MTIARKIARRQPARNSPPKKILLMGDGGCGGDGTTEPGAAVGVIAGLSEFIRLPPNATHIAN
jgi:hypothetical protein